MTRPYSWVDGDRGLPYGDVRESRPLSGWGPAEVVAGGVPVIVRRGIREEADAVFRAYLDQPVVHYCHIEDLRDGLGALGDAASLINASGRVSWCSLQEIARTNFETRARGGMLEVRPFSHHVVVACENPVEEIKVVPPHALAGVPYDVRAAGDGRVEVTFRTGEPRPGDQVAAPRGTGVALPRRLAAEARDRTRALVWRPRRAASARSSAQN
jgi:hypothetical protein